MLGITRAKVSGGWRMAQAINPTNATHNTSNTMAARNRTLRMNRDFSAPTE